MISTFQIQPHTSKHDGILTDTDYHLTDILTCILTRWLITPPFCRLCRSNPQPRWYLLLYCDPDLHAIQNISHIKGGLRAIQK